MTRPRVFDIRKEDLERLRRKGYGRVMIAKVYGCNDTTVRHWLIKFGLPTTLPMRKPSKLRMELMESHPKARAAE